MVNPPSLTPARPEKRLKKKSQFSQKHFKTLVKIHINFEKIFTGKINLSGDGCHHSYVEAFDQEPK
uniref:Uncharacterized protein n=1 Tax=Rhizophora mucronata TaxID=61149 RepID=A0A2P2PMB4_RHIMU